MVESDGVVKALEGEQRAGDAAQALTAILQTQYLRYMIIASWGVGLLGTVGLWPALLWFGGTLAAGSLRGIVEHRLSHRVGTNWGVIFPIVATVTTGAWAIAPLMAWFSPTEFGRPLALALLISGYVLVFAQLRSSPRQALIISSPYGAAATIILFSLWGTNAFWSMLAVLPFTAAGLFVLVTMTLLREDRSGAGIAAADLERLFMPFTQVDTSSTRRFGGTGLGLTIARRMANIMGGDITVTSKLAEGSCFTLEIEAEVVEWAKPVAAAEVHAEIEGGESLRVLVVEDHPVNRMILEAWMSSASHVTSTAENGQIAVDIAKDQPFDLIIMDVNMPVMDGLTATRMIREGGQNAGTPIVVLSASARHEDHEAGLQAGADAYLNKPIDFGALAALMGRVGGGRDAVAQMALPSSETSVAA
ncbi:response regulator [Brevundimonas vesicularis]|uniref:ATP-binding response regulator n=1 Tax=Brevundimonas vesicularis TaxID=41276 RepID=UPI0015740ACD|nr:response regulator [Brevundimonas vesicularis]NSX33594.1 response regulator [Brevundimonas vesicularis]